MSFRIGSHAECRSRGTLHNVVDGAGFVALEGRRDYRLLVGAIIFFAEVLEDLVVGNNLADHGNFHGRE